MENTMEATLNKVVIIGRLNRDPEIRNTPAGKTTASFTVLTTSEWRDRSASRCTKSFMHRVMVFESESAKYVARRVRKGTRVYLEGELQLRRWINKETGDLENFVSEIVLSGFNARLAVLDDPLPETAQTEASAEDDLDASPVPLSIKRSAAKYGDGIDTIDAGLSFLAQQKD
jgi:single stranded DNA-binding protein